jgi:hypothetical protein
MQAQQEAAQQGGQEEQGGEDGAAPADLSESVTHTKGFEPQNQPPQQGQ